MLDEFKPYAKVVNLNEPCDIEFDYFIACSGHFHLVEQIKNLKRKKTLLWIHHFVNMGTTVIANEETCKNMLDGIITVSQNVTDRLIAEFPHTKTLITTIYNVLNVEEIQEKAKKNMKLKLSKELNLVTVARVSMSKGFGRMLELAKCLKEANINFKWFIIGGNYYQDEEAEIRKMFEPYKEHFEWYGFIKNPHKIVKQCDYSVLLSDDETWGLVLTEAMLLGVPCIATDFDVVFEQITDKKNGIILSMNDTESYKDRIEDIMKNTTGSSQKFWTLTTRGSFASISLLDSIAERIMTASVMPTFSSKYAFSSSLRVGTIRSRRMFAGSFQFSQVTTFSLPPTLAFALIPSAMRGAMSPRFLPPTAVKTASDAAICSAIASSSVNLSAFAPVTVQESASLPRMLTKYCPLSLMRSTSPSNFSTKVNLMSLR